MDRDEFSSKVAMEIRSGRVKFCLFHSHWQADGAGPLFSKQSACLHVWLTQSFIIVPFNRHED